MQARIVDNSIVLFHVVLLSRDGFFDISVHSETGNCAVTKADF